VEQRRIRRLEVFAIPGIPEVVPGDDVGILLCDAMDAAKEPWQVGDVVVVAQKVVSKAEGRIRLLDDVQPTARAFDIAARSGKDARKVQAILDESAAVLRIVPARPDGLIIVRHRRGWVCANAGIDESNLGKDTGQLLLLPQDPDASARRIADAIQARTSVRPGVVVTDTFGRAWRCGLVNVAIGLSDVPAIVDWIGRHDAYGKPLRVTQQALADELAAASGLLSLKDAGAPATVFRNLDWRVAALSSGHDMIRSLKEDLFQ